MILSPAFKDAARHWLHDAYRLSALHRLGGAKVASKIDGMLAGQTDEKSARALAILIDFPQGDLFLKESK